MPPKTPKATDDDRELDKPTDDDTEGHNFMLHPSTARELARSREQDIQRATREHQRQKEAKRK